MKPEIEAADMIIRRVSNEAPPALPISIKVRRRRHDQEE
jgi:hypothetical protein